MKSLRMSMVLLAAILVSMTTAAETKKGAPTVVQWQSTKVNETVTAEAVLDILVKGFDSSGDLHGSLRIALFGETVPMTVLNFFSICNGVKRPYGELKYTNTRCHRMVRDINIQCGDTSSDESGGSSIYGETFTDENFIIAHSERGTVGMANRGPNSNGSQFFINFNTQQSNDNFYVAFGQVVGNESLEFLKKLSDVELEENNVTPKKAIKIVDCQAKEVKRYKIQRRASVNDDKF